MWAQSVERLLELQAVERPRLQHHIETSPGPCQHAIENWRADFYSEFMTDALTESLEAKVAEVAALEDLVERGLAARLVRDQLAATDRTLYAIQQAAVRELREGRTWEEVGRLFGRTGSWAEALAKGRKPRRKSDHAVESTPHVSAEEGRSPDTAPPESR